MLAAAFDSTGWLAKRELMSVEAGRLEKLYTKVAAETNAPAEQVRIPIENFPDGSVKTLITAAQSRYDMDERVIWGKDVAVIDYRKGGGEASRVSAENCVVDQNTRSGWINGRAEAVSGTTVLTGTRAYISATNEYVMIMSGARLQAVVEDFKSASHSKTGVPVVVTAPRADYDRKQGVIMLDNGITLVEEECELNSNQAFVFLNGTNDVRKVVVLGEVKVKYGERGGACDRAIYERGIAQLTMYAGEGKVATLFDNSERRSMLEGRKIVFHLDTEQVEVHNSRITMETKGTQWPIR